MSANANRFHLSLNVSDLTRSVQFFTKLFGQSPAKQRPDYAKFELGDPPLVLSLEPHAPHPGGALNHVGFRLPDSATLVEWQRRLEIAGIPTQREEGVECCYARQTKFWVQDPDRNLWEFYVLEEDIAHRGAGQVPEKMVPPTVALATPTQSQDWEHRLGEELRLPLPFENESLTEVRLSGTFNVPLEAATRRILLEEIKRVLEPGGRISLHVLTADQALQETPSLPGPAAYVRHVPVDYELMEELRQAGFVDLQFTKLGASPCFHANGVEMRETKLVGEKPAAQRDQDTRIVIYKGPFRQVIDDYGQVYPRGKRVSVDVSIAEKLRQGDLASQFVCVAAADPQAVACGA